MESMKNAILGILIPLTNKRLLKSSTHLKSPSNPLLKLVDLEGVAQMAQNHGVWTMIDNTFASPVNQNPLALGIDIVLHSATKYLGGHSDISAGVVVSSKAVMQSVINSARNYGGNLSEMMVWLLERSIKTLALRVHAQNENARGGTIGAGDWSVVDSVFKWNRGTRRLATGY
jgi:cystathionine beta-lyase/cystathionine gamma-synthase